MDLKQLRMFVEAADAGGLSRIAVKYGVVHATVSKQITALEGELGGKLFHRTGRGLALTELGQALVPRARVLLGEADLLLSATQDLAAVPRGQVTVGIQSSATRLLGSALLRQARERYPAIRVRVMEGYSAHIRQWVASGQADLGIVNSYGSASGRGDAVARVRLWLVGPGSEAAVRQTSVRFAALARLPLALPGHPNGLRLMLEETARRCKVALNVAMEVDSIPILKDLVSGGGLYTILPLHAVIDDLHAARVDAALITHPALTRSLSITATRAHPLSTAARLIQRLIREVAVDLAAGNAWEQPLQIRAG